jgi:LysR family transcriptional regulator, regulator for bpeEF and oprC
VDEIGAMRIFIRVIQSGSFSAVAREAGVGQPAISKQVAALETHVGTQLLRRTSRNLSLTEAGQDFYESALRVVDDLDAAVARAGHGQSSPRGLIRATVAPVFGRLYILPHLQEFFGRFPGLTLDLVVTERTVNMVEEGIDLAIHNGELNDSSCIARRIATTHVVTVGTPAYLREYGVPATPRELDAHRCVVYAPRGAPRPWGFRAKSGPMETMPKGNFRTNDAEQIRAAVLAGLGLAHAPAWLFAPEIAPGAVEVVLREYEPAPLPISAVYLAELRLPTKLRLFIDFLAEMLPVELERHALAGLADGRQGTEPKLG